MLRYTLKKNEILSKKKEINTLFSDGASLFKYPLKMVYILKEKENDNSSKVLFSVTVPKRNIKKAVKRNLIKRRMREAYRLNKNKLYNKISNDKQLVLMFVFVGKQPEKFDLIDSAIKNIINRFRTNTKPPSN